MKRKSLRVGGRLADDRPGAGLHTQKVIFLNQKH
jgi:hypothetical protein